MEEGKAVKRIIKYLVSIRMYDNILYLVTRHIIKANKD